MFEKRRSDVVIVGAGPVGLTTALMLAERGVEVQIIDEQWRTTSRSYGLALHPSSLRLFDSLGMHDELSALGNPIASLSVYGSGRLRASTSLDGLQGPPPHLLAIPQQALEEALRRRLERKGITVGWNHRLSALEDRGESVRLQIERLSKESTGYSVSRTEWIVDKSFSLEARFVVGADGHRSAVRNSLGLAFQENAAVQVFSVFEFASSAPAGRDVQLVLDEDTTSVLWPMKDGRFRWSFGTTDVDSGKDPRFKSRLAVQIRDEVRPDLSAERLRELLQSRAPWFDAPVEEIVWSAAVRFESRLSSSYGQGRVWLAGDAVHLALPMGIQSMNAGLLEAADLGVRIPEVLRQQAPLASLAEYGSRQRAAWKNRLGLEPPPLPASLHDAWLREQFLRLRVSLPASGGDLDRIIEQLK